MRTSRRKLARLVLAASLLAVAAASVASGGEDATQLAAQPWIDRVEGPVRVIGLAGGATAVLIAAPGSSALEGWSGDRSRRGRIVALQRKLAARTSATQRSLDLDTRTSIR